MKLWNIDDENTGESPVFELSRIMIHYHMHREQAAVCLQPVHNRYAHRYNRPYNTHQYTHLYNQKFNRYTHSAHRHFRKIDD